MLHGIPDICELVAKNRSEIYAMLNNGEMSYVIGSDGKRKIETSELHRVFPDLKIADGLASKPTESVSINADKQVKEQVKERKSITLSQAKEQENEVQRNQTHELYELRGMITDLRGEIDNVLDDNRRLLRLLEHQTMRNDSPVAQEPARPASTDVAKQGWKQYQKNREAEQFQSEENEVEISLKATQAKGGKENHDKPPFVATTETETHWLEVVKNFFLKY